METQQPPSEAPQEFCMNCGARFTEGAVFCERCGAVRPSVRALPPTQPADWRTWVLQRERYQPVAKRSAWRRTIKAVMAYMMISVILSVLAGLITLVYGVGIVAPDILHDPDWEDGYPIFIVVPVFIELFSISGYALLTYYLLVVAAIVACCAWVFLTSYKDFFKELTMTAEPRKHSPVFDISGLIFVEMFAILVTVLIAILLGINDTEEGVTGTTSELLFALANASVWEELIVRVLMIGLPMVVVDLVARKGHREWKRYILGGGFRFGVPEIVLLMASSAIFGYAHYLGGWQAWIVPWDALGGVAFGYLFLRHGLASAIVLHFAVDYRAMPTEVFGFSEGYELVLFMIWMALGAIFAVYYLIRIGEFLTGKKYLEEQVYYLVPYHTYPTPYPPMPQQWQQYPTQSQPQQVTQIPPTQSGFAGGFVCPYCGNTEARWINGRFQCLRCNRLS